MNRILYIFVLIAVYPCLASEGLYTYNSFPEPQINYLKTPYEQIRDVNSAAHFDASTSYDPEGGRIVEWKWNFYKYNGKSWDFLFTISGPDKAVINCKFPVIGSYRVRLWVRASDGTPMGRWNQDSDVKDCFVYVIYTDISADKYIAVGSGLTFTYIIKLPKDIQVKEAYITVLDEYDQVIAEIRIKNPVIGQETKINWNGKATKGPNAGESIPPGSFRINFRVFPFHSIPKKTNNSKTDNST